LVGMKSVTALACGCRSGSSPPPPCRGLGRDGAPAWPRRGVRILYYG
jgi:hypothetical protein